MEGDSGNSGAYRAAKLAVIILTALFALAVVALVVGFVRQYRIYRAARAAHGPETVAADASVANTPAISLTLARGTHILSAAVQSGKLVLQLATPKGEEVDVIDLATGKRAAEIKAPQ